MDLHSDNLAYLSSLITANLDPNVKVVLFKHHTVPVEYRQPDTLLVPQIPSESSLE
jgi:hypothetical protein